MKRPFSATVRREGEWFVSQCLDVNIASQGRTEEEALENLREALELHFEPPVATHLPEVRQIGGRLKLVACRESRWLNGFGPTGS